MTRSAGDRLSVALDENEEWLVASRRKDSLAVVVSASLSATLSNLTLAATATDPGSALLAATIADLTLAATIAVIDQAALDATIGAITLVATDQDVISAAVD